MNTKLRSEPGEGNTHELCGGLALKDTLPSGRAQRDPGFLPSIENAGVVHTVLGVVHKNFAVSLGPGSTAVTADARHDGMAFAGETGERVIVGSPE